MLLPHALALSAIELVHKKVYTSTNSGGFQLAKLTFTKLEHNLMCYRGSELYRADRPAGLVG